MPVDIDRYVDSFLRVLDALILDNFGDISGYDLSRFYSIMFKKLKEEYFGGSWGFEGVTEFLILRALYYIGREKYNGETRVVSITGSLRGFYFSNAGPTGLVLSAGRPLTLNYEERRDYQKNRIWPDILVYEPTTRDSLEEIDRIRSAIEIKAYPQSGFKGIKDTLERLDNIRRLYGDGVKLAFIIYDYPVRNKRQSKIWRYLMGERVEGYGQIPSHIDVLVLSITKEKVKNLLSKYI